MRISNIKPRKILDSRGFWTLETTITTSEGIVAFASVPSGTSTGKSEALALQAYEAVSATEEIFLDIAGKEFDSQLDFDNELIAQDGTSNKAKLGANSILALSVAFCRAQAKSKNIPLYKHINEIGYFSGALALPKLMMLMFEGGKHGSGSIDFQELMYVTESVDEGVLLYQKIKNHLEDEHLSTQVGLEGAFSPRELTNVKALKIMSRISPITPISLDIAQSSRTGREIDFAKLFNDHKLFSVEDPYGEEAWSDWTSINKLYQSKVMVVGDDLTTTNPTRIQRAIDENCISGVIIKPNQIGTVSETLTAINLAKSAGLAVIVSHRSGETNDDFIADLAVGAEANYVKFGAPSRGERVAKYNRLITIQGELFQTIA